MHRRFIVAALVLTAFTGCASTSPGLTAIEAPRAVVFFTPDSALLDEVARGNIREAVQMAQADPAAPVRVLGFAAPNTGTPAFNQTLSQTRAQNVADALVAAGVSRERVRVQTRAAVPFTLMQTEARRVEIVVGS